MTEKDLQDIFIERNRKDRHVLLDIVIPHYHEPKRIVRPLIEMLGNQKMVDFKDFRVTMIHDDYHSNWPKKFMGISLADYQLDFNEIFLDRQCGVSYCRNLGMDLANSDWICFCDCDDTYTSIYALYNIMYIMRQADEYDVLWNPLYINPIKKELGLTKSDEFNHVFIHNKYYRLSFLREHNIRFAEELYMSEDSAFNTVVKLELSPGKVGKINTPEPLYAWCRREGSITTDPDRYQRTVEGHFKRNLYVLGEYDKRECRDAFLAVVRTVTDVYAMTTKTGKTGNFDPARKMCREFYLKEKNRYKQATEEQIQKALDASDKDIGTTDQEKQIRIPFDQWLKELIGDGV